MERQQSEQQAEKIKQIISQARERYGTDAEFAYLDRVRREVVMMELEDAVRMCGQHMAHETTEGLWSALDPMYGAAETLKTRGDSVVEQARTLGAAALQRRLGGN